MKKKRIEHNAIITVVFLALGIIFCSPFLLLLINAFKPYNDMVSNFLAWPKSFYLDNFVNAVVQMHFLRAVGNSAIITIGTMAVATIISFTASYGIYHIQGKLGKLLYLFFTLGQIIPFHSIMIALSVQLNKLGLNNKYIALIILYSGFHCCFGVFTYYGFLKSIPKELEEAAEIDGCSVLKSMTLVVFPLLKSTTITLNVLFLGKNKKTLTVMIYMFKSTSGSKWNLLLAGLVLAIVPVVVIYVIAQKYITEGLTAGAVKG